MQCISNMWRAAVKRRTSVTAAIIGVFFAVLASGLFHEAHGIDSRILAPANSLGTLPRTTLPTTTLQPRTIVPTTTATTQFRIVSLTVEQSQVQNLEYRVASIWSPPNFTATIDRYTAATETVRVWITSSAPDIVEPPKAYYDEKGYQVTGPNNFAFVGGSSNKAVFGLNIHPVANLTSPRIVTITATVGSTQAVTTLTIMPPPPNPVVSLTAANNSFTNGTYQGTSGPHLTLTLSQAVTNVVSSSTGAPVKAAEKVWITSSDPGIIPPPSAYYSETGGPAGVPNNFVLVPYGEKQVTFDIPVYFTESLNAQKTVIITASNATGRAAAQVTITPIPPYRVISAAVTPSSFRVGQNALPTMTVTLDRTVEMPNGALNYYRKVWVASSAPDIVVAPRTSYDPNGALIQGDNGFIMVRPGSSSGSGPVSIAPSVLTGSTAVTLTAGEGPDRAGTAVQASTSLTVTPILLKRFGPAIQPPQPICAGSAQGVDKGFCTLEVDNVNTLSSIMVKLSSAEPDVLNFTGTWESTPSPYWCTIERGYTGSNFNVAAIPPAIRKTFIGEDRDVVIYADYMGQRLTATVPVLWPRAFASLTITPPSQYGSSTATVTLDRPAPASGLQVQISSSNRSAFLTLPYAVNFAAGKTTATFVLALRTPYSSFAGTTVTVSASPYWNTSTTATVPTQ
jgi:hypothetical protein